jgi:ketosteroid isomerase-like protein
VPDAFSGRPIALLAVLTALFPGALVAQGARAASRADSLALAGLEARVEAAVVRHDVAFLGGVYAPDFRFKHSTGLLQNREQWLTALARTPYVSREVDSLDVEVHGDVALTTGRVHVRSATDDPKWREYTVRYARVYARQGGRWRLLTHHSTGESFGPLR